MVGSRSLDEATAGDTQRSVSQSGRSANEACRNEPRGRGLLSSTGDGTKGIFSPRSSLVMRRPSCSNIFDGRVCSHGIQPVCFSTPHASDKRLPVEVGGFAVGILCYWLSVGWPPSRVAPEARREDVTSHIGGVQCTGRTRLRSGVDAHKPFLNVLRRYLASARAELPIASRQFLSI